MFTSLWSEFLTIVKEEAGSRVVDTWFKAVSLCQWDAVEKVAYLEAPNNFVKSWIKNHYIPLIQLHLGRLLNVAMPRVVFIEGALPVNALPVITTGKNALTVIPAVALPMRAKTIKRATLEAREGNINKAYSFDSFIVGPNNSLAYAAAHAVTESPGKVYNPLFIYGDSGLGKTHLLHAIGNNIRSKDDSRTILYQTADRFVSEFINAIRFDKVQKFKTKYKMVDVLLIDDIQYISNKEQTQEVFFHIFNSLYDARKQIVFSSDTIPSRINGVAERLRSRLACGLVTDIHVPPMETKIAIIKKKAEAVELTIDDGIAYAIAQHTSSNIRELEGALIRLAAYASLTHQQMSVAMVKSVLAAHTAPVQQQATYNVSTVLDLVAKQYGCTAKDIFAKNRNKNIAFARQVAMFLMKKTTDKSLRDIGILFSGRDHSTVAHAVEKVQEEALNDVVLNSSLEKMIKQIRG